VQVAKFPQPGALQRAIGATGGTVTFQDGTGGVARVGCARRECCGAETNVLTGGGATRRIQGDTEGFREPPYVILLQHY
jgi:hypothetical protein